MRKIASILAVAFAMLTAFAGTHMAAADTAQHSTQKRAVSISLTAQKIEQQTPAPATPQPAVVTVQEGDTLCGIASANGTTYMRLFDANSFISNPDLIYPGQQINVPTSSQQLTDRSIPTPATPAPAPAPAAPTATQPAAPAPAPVAAPTAASVDADTQGPVATEASAPAPAAAASVSSSADSGAKAYIYMHESGNNPDATNSNGCYGLGQDCSGQVRALCGDNYSCQDEWFTNYANSRYGGWNNALAFWQAHSWW